MDRNIYYSGQLPLSAQFLLAEKSKMIGLGMLARALYGDLTVAAGLACAPTSPATLSVNVGPGSLYSLQNVDNTAFGSLAADTADQILKQGINLGTTNLTVAAPGTVGYSINYLIQAAFSETDSAATILPYYNAANPTVSLLGPGGAGTSQNQIRGCAVTLSAKAGTAATTGSQVTPAADAGYVGLYVVTVAYGATSVTSGNISIYPGAPFVGNLPNLIQTAGMTTAKDSGAVNAYVMTLQPAPAALVPGMQVRMQNILHTNTGASTLNINGFGALPIQSAGGTALQGGELVIGYGAILTLNYAGTAWELIQTTGGPLPVKAGAQTQHAVNLGQFASSIAAPGYQKLPNGLIIQWGSVTTASGTAAATFPLAFPTGFLSATLGLVSALPVTGVLGYNSPSATGMTINTSNSQNGAAIVATVNYLAIGH